jgi:uncharacterized membrane protein YgdD (TMEM256/DUF423 family)
MLIWTQWVAVGAFSAAISVGLGAFGAHALKTRLSATDLATFEVGVRYHIMHALAILAVAMVASRLEHRFVHVAGSLFTVGTLLFSGSLYALALTGNKSLGMVTPVGGVCFIVAWLLLGAACLSA